MDESTNGLQNESTQPPSEMTAGAGEQPSADAEAKKSGKEDLKAALANLASALNKFGAVAEVRAREEWKQAKPEIQKALAEMKRAVETGSQKASTTIDSLGKKMDKNKTSEPGATTGTDDTSPINPTGWSDASKDDSTPPGA